MDSGLSLSHLWEKMDYNSQSTTQYIFAAIYEGAVRILDYNWELTRVVSSIQFLLLVCLVGLF